MKRKWRGTLDVPPTEDGLWSALKLMPLLWLDMVYHDNLSRCRRTAEVLVADKDRRHQTNGSRPWNMGPVFEGQEITEASLNRCRHLVNTPTAMPYQGESFGRWYSDWMEWIWKIEPANKRIGVITHNRNIQALYATHNYIFYPHLYDTKGPAFLTVHVYQNGHIAPWNGLVVPDGVYIIRHAETSYGT